MFWIFAENSIDNMQMFALLPSSAHTAPQPHPHSEEVGGAQWAERWHSWPQLTQGRFHHTEHVLLGEEGEGDIWSDDVCVSESLFCVMELFCTGESEHLPTHGTHERIPCFALPVCMGFALLLNLSLAQYTNILNILTFILPIFSSHTGRVCVNEWLCGAPAGVKPCHVSRRSRAR